MGKNIIFLSDITQSSLNNAFVEAMPWQSFGRKNIGYLYAIANGATVIWDFDDDNILKFWMKGATPDDSLEIDHFIDALNGNIFFPIFRTKVFMPDKICLFHSNFTICKSGQGGYHVHHITTGFEQSLVYSYICDL